MESGYKVGEIMVHDVIIGNVDDSIFDCAKKMDDNKISCIIITQSDIVQGIITEQDISRKVVAKGLNPSNVVVSQIMSRNISGIHPEKDLHEAITLMGTNEIKHLPVIESGKLVGIITSKDIVVIEPILIDKLEFNSKSKRENGNSLMD